jgi:ABC-type uncharacterized transport system involved in gliding motility auxiliary subunit
MTQRSTLGGGALLALALLFVGLTILFDHALHGWRLDLTQNRLYSTTPGTDRILKSLSEPINLYFFFTEKSAAQVPVVKTYGGRVREFLEELAARSNGKLRLHFVDPEPFSEDEDRASELGVRATPLGGAGGTLYFGLAGTNSTDGHAAIEFFDPSKEEFLEYDVVKLIYQLANPKKPVLGWLSSLPMTPSMDPQSGQMREPWVVYSQAQQLYTVRAIDPAAAKIDADVDVLVIVHPKHLAPATLFAIDQFVLKGGHIAVFVDPIAEPDTSGVDPQNPMSAMSADKSSNLEPLLGAWGVAYNPRQVIADAKQALSVSLHENEAPSRHYGILGLEQSNFNHTDVVTAGLSSVNVAMSGYLKPAKGATTHFEPLLMSSNEAEPLATERFAMLFDPGTLRDGFKPTGERYAIGARVTGNIKTAYPGGPPAGVTLPPGTAALKTSAKPLQLIVFADVDMLADYLWVRQQNIFGQRVAQAWANNGDLMSNVLDNLSGSADLISVRGRATFTRPFERVEALRRSADDRFRSKEHELEQELRTTEEKLTALESRRNDKSSVILTPEQERELNRFQDEKLQVRKELRTVRLGLDEEIRHLGTTLKVLNIVVVPAVLAVIALLVVGWRQRRRRAQHAMTQNRARP